MEGFDAEQISVAPEILAQKKTAISSASGITSVADEMDQTAATEIMRDIQTLLKGMENTRETLKRPALEIGRAIDSTAKAFSGELEAEMTRLKKLVGDFQTKIHQEAQAELERQRKVIEEANRVEAERQAEEARRAAAAVATPEPLDRGAVAIGSPYGAGGSPFDAPGAMPSLPPKAPIIVPTVVAEAPKAQGMSVKEVVRVEVMNLAAVYRTFPELVTLTLNQKQAEAYAQAGKLDTCPGIKVIRENAVSVRSR